MRANPVILKRERRLQLAAFGLVLFSGLGFLVAVNSVLISFLISILIAYLLKPAVNAMERLGSERSSAITLIFVLLSAAFFLAVYLLAPLASQQVSDFQSEMPRYKEGLTLVLEKLQDKVNGSLGSLYSSNLKESFYPYANKYLVSSIEQLPQAATKVLTILILAPFFAFFLLRDGRSISRWLFSLVPNHLFEVTLSVTNKINEQVGGFIRARILEAAIVGFVVFLGLQIISFPYAVILAIFAGLTNLIPYVGPIIGAIPALFVAVVDKDGSLAVILVTSIYFIAQLIDMLFIIPLVVARIVNLHPVLVVVAIILGAEVMGILGMIISIPVFSALKLIFSAIYSQLLAQKADA